MIKILILVKEFICIQCFENFRILELANASLTANEMKTDKRLKKIIKTFLSSQLFGYCQSGLPQYLILI